MKLEQLTKLIRVVLKFVRSLQKNFSVIPGPRRFWGYDIGFALLHV